MECNNSQDQTPICLKNFEQVTIFSTTAHSWHDIHSTSISACGVWGAKIEVQDPKREFQIHIHLNLVRVDFYLIKKKKKFFFFFFGITTTIIEDLIKGAKSTLNIMGAKRTTKLRHFLYLNVKKVFI